MATNPFMAKLSNSEEDGTGKSSSSNPFLSATKAKAAYRKKQQEEADAQYQADQLKQKAADDAKKATEDAKTPLQHLQDAIGGVGNFVKDAAVSVKDDAVNAYTGVSDVIKGSVAVNNQGKLQQGANDIQNKANKQITDIYGKYQDKGLVTADGGADESKMSKADLDKIAQLKAQRDKDLAQYKKDNNFDQETQKNKEALDKSQKVDSTKTAFAAASTALNIGTLGVGAPIKALVEQGVKTGGKALIEQAVKTGGADAMETLIKARAATAAKIAAEQATKKAATSTAKKIAGNAGKDAVLGAGFGTVQTGTNVDWNDPNAPKPGVEDFAKNAALGAGFGAAVPVVGAGFKKGFDKVVGKFGDTRVGQAVANKVDDVKANVAEGNVAKAADKATEKYTKPDGTIDINQMMNDAIKNAEDKHSKNIFTRVKAYVGDNVNPLGFARAIDQNAAKRMGVKYADLPAADSLEHNLQLRNRSDGIVDTMAKEATPTGQSFQDLAKKYKTGSKEAAEFANYTAAKYDLDRRTQGRQKIIDNADDASLAKFVDDYEAKNPDAVKDLQTKNAFYGNAAKELKDGGLISEKEYNDIVSSSDVATPFNRIFADKEALTETPKFGRRAGSIAKQTTIQGIKGGTEPIDASLDVVLQRVKKAVEQRIDNKIANSFRTAVESGDVAGRVFQEAGAKEAKAAARAERIESNRQARILGRKVSITNRQAGKLQREIDRLNTSAMKESIKGAGGKEMPKQPVKTVTVKTVADRIKENAPKTLDDLKQSYQVKAALKKEYGSGENAIKQMAADIHNGGWDQLLKLSNGAINKSTAKSLANQILKEPTIKKGGITVFEGTIGKAPTMKSVVDSLVNMTPRQVTALRKKIATREPKLAAILDKVNEQKMAQAAKKNAASEFRDMEVGLTREGTTGKAFISGLQDGKTFRVELPPHLINSLDKLSKTDVLTVLKPLAVVNQVFRMAWVGALSPGFAIKSALWDVVMTANNSKNGFRTLGPKAVIASLKAIRESDEFTKKLRKSGAGIVGASQLGINHAVSAETLGATRSVASRIVFSAKHPTAIIDSLDVLGGKLASLGRTRAAKAAYDDAIRRKLPEEKALADAAYAYNNVLPDFNTMSPLVRQINAVIPFTNASIAGTRSLAQAFKRKPLETAAKVAAMGVTPAIAIAAYSMGSDDGKKFYDDMIAAGNETTLDNNFIITLPGITKKDEKTGQWTGVIKIPITPEFRSINSQAWRQIYGGAKGGDLVRTAADTFDFITGGVRTLSNPLVDMKTILDNKDPRTGEQLVSDDMQQLPKNEQTYDTTSTAGRIIGGLTNTSPIQADKILGQFGLTGQALKKGSPAEALKDNLVGTVEGASGESINNSFYKAYTPAAAKRSQVSKEVTNLVKMGNVNQARRIAKEYNDTLATRFSPFLQKYSTSSEYSKQYDEMLNGLTIKTSDASFESRAKAN